MLLIRPPDAIDGSRDFPDLPLPDPASDRTRVEAAIARRLGEPPGPVPQGRRPSVYWMDDAVLILAPVEGRIFPCPSGVIESLTGRRIVECLVDAPGDADPFAIYRLDRP